MKKNTYFYRVGKFPALKATLLRAYIKAQRCYLRQEKKEILYSHSVILKSFSSHF